MRCVLTVVFAVLMPLLASAAPQAKPASGKPKLTQEQFVKLAQTYQEGYLQLVAISAAQIYSTTGLVATQFSKGQLDGPAAADALSDTAMLHSVCYATLLDVQKNTPKDDAVATQQIGKLAGVLVGEKQLMLALTDVFSNPTEKNAARVQTARESVGKLLDKLLAE